MADSKFRALLWANLLATLRNPMALVYGWLFPLFFLAGFWALYGDDPVPLALHAGQFFTITILGSAAFGLPTQMVAEREAGLWRHYALTPAPRWRFVAALVLARALLLAGALIVQHWAARSLGMPPLPHPVSTVLALATASLCFLCIGALIGNLAPNVPAVQALGQCVFLPMLIIGGVAVPLASLPEWALPLSNLLPGRHAVVAIQTAVTGTGTRAAGFELAALAGHGLIALLAAVLLFRWEPAAPPPAGRRGLWLLPLLALWLALAAVAQQRQRSVPAAPDTAPAGQVADFLAPAASDATSAVVAAPAPAALPATAPKASRPQAGLRPRPVPTAPANRSAPSASRTPTSRAPNVLDRLPVPDV
jgi:ABC-2 type transport system permease protein